MQRRYITLAPHLMLRGWRDQPCVLYDWEESAGIGRKALPLTDAQRFGIELAASPGVSIDDPLLPPGMKKAAEEMLRAGAFVLTDKEGGLAEYQKYRYHDTRMVHALVWSLTGRCNLRCRHCYVSADEGAYGEYSFAQCEEIVRQMLEAGIQMVALTGGEPLFHPHFWPIIDLLKESHIHVEEIFTNGLLVTEDFLDKLEKRDLHIHCFLLSLDGAGCHDWIRGMGGAEEKAREAIRRLRRRSYPTVVSTVVHEGNLASLPATYELMKELDVTDWKVGPVVVSGNWKKNGGREVDDQSFLEACMGILERYVADGMPMRLKLGGLFEHDPREGNVYHIPSFSGCGKEGREKEPLCEAIRATPLLLPNGKLLTCLPMAGTELEEIAPNILEDGWSISRALTESPVEAYTRATYGDLFRENRKCGKCPERLRCHHCPAEGLGTGDSIFAIDGHNCLIAGGGYEERVRALMGKEFKAYPFG